MKQGSLLTLVVAVVGLLLALLELLVWVALVALLAYVLSKVDCSGEHSAQRASAGAVLQVQPHRSPVLSLSLLKPDAQQRLPHSGGNLGAAAAAFRGGEHAAFHCSQRANPTPCHHSRSAGHFQHVRSGTPLPPARPPHPSPTFTLFRSAFAVQQPFPAPPLATTRPQFDAERLSLACQGLTPPTPGSTAKSKAGGRPEGARTEAKSECPPDLPKTRSRGVENDANR